MDTGGFSTQRCDGIYIRRMETCARSMQQIFRFSALILKQQQQLFHDFQVTWLLPALKKTQFTV